MKLYPGAGYGAGSATTPEPVGGMTDRESEGAGSGSAGSGCEMEPGR